MKQTEVKGLFLHYVCVQSSAASHFVSSFRRYFTILTLVVRVSFILIYFSAFFFSMHYVELCRPGFLQMSLCHLILVTPAVINTLDLKVLFPSSSERRMF